MHKVPCPVSEWSTGIRSGEVKLRHDFPPTTSLSSCQPVSSIAAWFISTDTAPISGPTYTDIISQSPPQKPWKESSFKSSSSSGADSLAAGRPSNKTTSTHNPQLPYRVQMKNPANRCYVDPDKFTYKSSHYLLKKVHLQPIQAFINSTLSSESDTYRPGTVRHTMVCIVYWG